MFLCLFVIIMIMINLIMINIMLMNIISMIIILVIMFIIISIIVQNWSAEKVQIICLSTSLGSAYQISAPLFHVLISFLNYSPQVINLKLTMDYGLPSSLCRRSFRIWTFLVLMRFVYLCFELLFLFYSPFQFFFLFLFFFIWQEVFKVVFFNFSFSLLPSESKW